MEQAARGKAVKEQTITPRFFLVQGSGKRPAEHFTEVFEDRSYADEVAEHHYYRNEAWDLRTKDRDFGNARAGDYILHYCTGGVRSNPNAIKHIYKIAGTQKVDAQKIRAGRRSGRISQLLNKSKFRARASDLSDKTNEVVKNLRKRPHILLLEPHVTLKRRLGLDEIKNLIRERTLSEKMRRCGQLGFNICQVEKHDYDVIIEWDKRQERIDTPNLAEKELRDYLAAKRDLEELGPRYKQYQLVQKEFDTRTVGRIDLLYQDTVEGDFLVAEIKKTEDTGRKVVGQIASYMGWVKQNLAKGKTVHGLIIVRSATPKLLAAVSGMGNCELASYEATLSFNIVDVQG